MLLPCYKKDCIHPICAAGRPKEEHLWFKGGPPLSYLPLPIPDPEWPWGKPCTSCVGPCVGHYLSPEKNWEKFNSNGSTMFQQPPRKILGDFMKTSINFTDSDVQRFARECLLSEEDVLMWLKNVQKIKKTHAKKQCGKGMHILLLT